jgi:hypothetical protein
VTNTKSLIGNVGFYGGLFRRMHHFRKAGDWHRGHKHHIDHTTFLFRGGVRVSLEGQEPVEYYAPTFIEIDKDVHHQFTALEDDTMYVCLFAARDAREASARPLSPQERASMLAGMTETFCGNCQGCK